MDDRASASGEPILRASTSTTSRLLRAVTLQKQTTDDATEAVEVSSGFGPLGLTTVYSPLGGGTADIVFVHGLGGGSRKTWTKNGNPTLFWPGEWLPQDPAFRDVRIHTFGYDSTWEKESVLDLHDFAKSLLYEIVDGFNLSRVTNGPLILVCHSLGGLVAKRAYILAKQVKDYDAFAQRTQAIVFLATPHRGSKYAETLSKLLQLASGARPFVGDLHTDSAAIQAINEEFPFHSRDLELYSFYETMPTNLGFKKGLIVEKDSALLGYDNERSQYLNANHRDVCKFSTPNDANYRTVRNALSSVLLASKEKYGLQRRDLDDEQQKWLMDMLDASDTHDEVHQRIDSWRMPGSCTWVTETPAFQQWSESPTGFLYWISAKPGAGKSVLSSYIIGQLKDRDHACSFHFFGADKHNSHACQLLRSIAWQMSQADFQVFNFLVKLLKKEPQLSRGNDSRTLWRKLFMEGIFKQKFSKRQYWVIDALDECRSPEVSNWLFKAAETGCVRVLITSRNQIDFQGGTPPRGLQLALDCIPLSCTETDIRMYLNANKDVVPALGSSGGESRDTAMMLILEKSAGCFLWVRLVLQELRTVFTETEVSQVLEEIPSDMDDLYTRIVNNMSTSVRGKQLAHAILVWTVCSAQPLTVDELSHALQIDIKDQIISVRNAIAQTCGQLVFIDANSRVVIIHQTARDFLLKPGNPSEFAVARREGHKRLASVCLRYLSSTDFHGPKSRKLSNPSMAVVNNTPFASYACTSFWEHIPSIPSEDDQFLLLLVKFLNSSAVLAWIEFVAASANLQVLIQTGRAFKNLLHRRSRHALIMGKDLATLDSWAIDLVRLVTRFGRQLRASPHSIFQLIPPFCPADTAIRRQFTTNRSIAVSGLSDPSWDDCMSTITHKDSTPISIECLDGFFVIGMKNGQLKIYDENTCQYVRTIRQDEPVTLLKSSVQGDLLTSVGRKTITMWETTNWQQLTAFKTDDICVALAFADQDRLLVAALRNSELWIWNLDTGHGEKLSSWVEAFDENSTGKFPHPTAVAFAEGTSHMAIAYRGLDVIIWDIDEEIIFDLYGQDKGSLGPLSQRRVGVSTINRLAYSRGSEGRLLAAAANDGMLMIFNTDTGVVQAKLLANVHSLESSADGLFLATGNSGGTIQIWEFETLKLLYSIRSEEFGIKDLAFSADGDRLIDIRANHCRVWDPPLLVRQEVPEDSVDTISISTTTQDYIFDERDLTLQITSFATAEALGIAFCGKIDGTISVFDARTGQEVSILFRHSRGVSITSLLYNKHNMTLISTDSSSRVVAQKVLRGANEWHVDQAVFDHHFDGRIDQVLSNRDCTRLFVSCTDEVSLWSLGTSATESVSNFRRETPQPSVWLCHPQNHTQLVMVSDDTAHLYDWSSLTRTSTEAGIHMQGTLLPELSVRSVVPCFGGRYLATTFSSLTRVRSQSKLLVWDVHDFGADSVTAAPVPHYQILAEKVAAIVGSYGRKLVFLDHDGWVCSADADHFDPENIDKHFFFPHDWLNVTDELMVTIFENGNIMIVQRDEVAVVRRGMEHLEQTHAKTTLNKRTSLARSSSYQIQRMSSRTMVVRPKD